MLHPPRPEPPTLRPALARFRIAGELESVVAHQRGHIHDTFISAWKPIGSAATRSRYLHQRMNERVFKDIDALMHNVRVVTGHLAREGHDGLMQTLELVPADDGAAFVRDTAGEPWRTYRYVEGTTTHDRCRDTAMAHEAARAFGDFQARLVDLDPTSLCETIPLFFSTPYRLEQLEEAIRHDAAARVATVQPELAFIAARRDLAFAIEKRLQAKAFPRRAVHGDTKLNNVLFDDRHRARCIVDLDTVMPAYSLYDFGDLVRFTAATSSEDERDLTKAGTDLDLYGALAAGYLERAATFLTPEERTLLPLSARLVTFTIGLRFLADHLNGDRYFKITRENHNLDRARVQLRMVAEMERLEPQMRPS
ncbi:MAG: aminoglycoside phosphotransferase family protein [Planctomycetes bacterium]|nr:aminoglycoside phosphotransferase family protein [Planctomycetota bacterium]